MTLACGIVCSRVLGIFIYTNLSLFSEEFWIMFPTKSVVVPSPLMIRNMVEYFSLRLASNTEYYWDRTIREIMMDMQLHIGVQKNSSGEFELCGQRLLHLERPYSLREQILQHRMKTIPQNGHKVFSRDVTLQSNIRSNRMPNMADHTTTIPSPRRQHKVANNLPHELRK